MVSEKKKFLKKLLGRKRQKSILNKFNRKIPYLIKNKCIKCGECALDGVCPTKAITFQPKKYPKFDITKCNSCFKCIDVCTYNAIVSKKAKLIGLFGKFNSLE
ncbi:MAG: ATP-binding protein [Promethearchaeota archaeon]